VRLRVTGSCAVRCSGVATRIVRWCLYSASRLRRRALKSCCCRCPAGSPAASTTSCNAGYVGYAASAYTYTNGFCGNNPCMCAAGNYCPAAVACAMGGSWCPAQRTAASGTPCQAGYYGVPGAGVQSYASGTCAGACTASPGYFCAVGSSNASGAACLSGYFCRGGSAGPSVCTAAGAALPAVPPRQQF
jgi:hypothetical protein